VIVIDPRNPLLSADDLDDTYQSLGAARCSTAVHSL
jgi:hypothetical protein